jgi:hypothetical protein
MPINRRPFVVGHRLACQPFPSAPIEQIRMRTLWDKMRMQDRVHFVLDPRSMTDKLIPSRRQPPLSLGGRVGGPDFRQESGRKQTRQRARVDLVGLHPCMSDRLHLQGIGDHHSPHKRRKNPGNRHAIPGRFNHHLVGWKQSPAQPLERRPGHVDPAEPPQLAVLPNHHSPKVRWMSIRSPFSSRASVPSHGSGGRHDTYGFALTAQPGKSQRRPATNSSSRLME